jgi:hypothetical protein
MRAVAERNLLIGRRTRAARPRRTEAAGTPDEVTIRRAGDGDAARLRVLARLDSSRPLTGPVLVAERNGALIAAIGLGDGRTIADPFEPTAAYVALLELRAESLRAS